MSALRPHVQPNKALWLWLLSVAITVLPSIAYAQPTGESPTFSEQVRNAVNSARRNFIQCGRQTNTTGEVEVAIRLPARGAARIILTPRNARLARCLLTQLQTSLRAEGLQPPYRTTFDATMRVMFTADASPPAGSEESGTIEDRFRAHMRTVLQCIPNERRSNGTRREFDVSVVVSPSGQIDAASITFLTPGADPEIVSCMEQRLRAFRVPPFRGSVATINRRLTASF